MLINWLKGYSLNNLRNKLILIYILNVLDWIFTLLLLSTGLFEEANPIMKIVIDDVILSGCAKIILPLILVLFIWSKIKPLGVKAVESLKRSNIWISICLIVYMSVCVYHMFNICTYVWF